MKHLVACLLVILLIGLVGCMPQEEIQNVPTPRVDTQTIVVKQDWPEDERTIVVTGNGEFIAQADFATVRVGVTAAGATAEEASLLCNERLRAIFDAAGTSGVSARDITAAGIEIEPRRNDGEEEIIDYLAKDTITVIVRNVAIVNGILTKVIDAGASETFAVTYSLTEASDAYREALKNAMQDAAEKAAVLAEAGGVRVKEVIAAEEQPYDESKLVGVDFESSAIAVDAKIVVTYRIG